MKNKIIEAFKVIGSAVITIPFIILIWSVIVLLELALLLVGKSGHNE